MELKHIEYFIEASRHKSLTQAAEHLFISQQALSSSIKLLEEELGCKLFVRTSKGITPTEDGRYMIDCFEPAVRRFRKLEKEALVHLAGQRKTISLVSAPLLFGILDPNILFSFRQEHPQIQVEINEMPDSEIEGYILAERARFGLISAPEIYLRKHFEYKTVRTFPIILCVNKENPLSRREHISFSDLAEEDFLSMGKNSLYHEATREKAASCGFVPNIVFESSDVNQLCKLLDSNKGIVIGTTSPAFGTIYPNIRTVPFSDPDMQSCIAFVYQSYDRLDDDQKMFIDFFVQNTQA